MVHGTGRYKYEKGNVFDTLQGILKDGGLVPHKDDWDIKRGAMQTVSTARSRSYARLYASLFFPPKKRSGKELISRFLSSCYFFFTSKWVAWREYPPPRPHILDFKRKITAWTTKLARHPQSFTGVFLWGGTDIPGNYPVLIGIRKGAIQPTRGSRFIDLHEDRSERPIGISEFTHIEVPAEYVPETLRVLEEAGQKLLVIPLEEGIGMLAEYALALVRRRWRSSPLSAYVLFALYPSGAASHLGFISLPHFSGSSLCICSISLAVSG